MKLVKHFIPSKNDMGHVYHLNWPETEKAVKQLSLNALKVWIILKASDPYGKGINVFNLLADVIIPSLLESAVDELERKGFVEVKILLSKESKERKDFENGRETEKLNLTEIQAKLVGYFQALSPDEENLVVDFFALAKIFKVTPEKVIQAILGLVEQNYLSAEITTATIQFK